MTFMRNGGGFQLRSNMDFAGLRNRLRFEHGPAMRFQAEKSDAALEDVDKDIEDCNAEIYRLQRRTIFLQNQRRRLEEYKACLCSIGSSIRKLPNETLLRIFDFACDMNEITSKNVGTMPVLAISGVCFRWRDLARSSPELWSCLRFEMQKGPPNRRRFPILNFFLSSSRNSPLTLELTGGIGTNLQTHHLDICNTLATHSHRWRRVLISGIYQFQRNVYSAWASHDLRHYSMLEELVFPSLDITDGLNQYQHAPKLHRLSIGDIGLVRLAESKFPWKQLTHFNYASYGDGMENIWQMCDKLVFLQLKDEVRDLHSIPPTTAPTLQTLSLELYKSSCAESSLEVAFSSITCPSLTSLIIEGKNGSARPWPKESLEAFISRSSFHLTTLSIKSLPLSDANLIELLYCVPFLHHLTIDDSKLPRSATTTSHTPSPFTSKLFQSLHAFPCASSTAGSSAIVQRLQSLDLTCAGSAFDDEGFVEMVSSRWPDYSDECGPSSAVNSLSSDIGTACLRSVVLCFRNRGLDVKKYRPMEYLEKAGMRVVLVGKNLS